MNLATRIQVLNEGICLWHNVNTSGKKVWIQRFPLHLWVNSRVDWLFNLGMETGLKEGKLRIQTSCRSGEGWAPTSNSFLRRIIWTKSQRPNQLTEPIRMRMMMIITLPPVNLRMQFRYLVCRTPGDTVV